jgi:hypothetical protein
MPGEARERTADASREIRREKGDGAERALDEQSQHGEEQEVAGEMSQARVQEHRTDDAFRIDFGEAQLPALHDALVPERIEFRTRGSPAIVAIRLGRDDSIGVEIGKERSVGLDPCENARRDDVIGALVRIKQAICVGTLAQHPGAIRRQLDRAQSAARIERERAVEPRGIAGFEHEEHESVREHERERHPRKVLARQRTVQWQEQQAASLRTTRRSAILRSRRVDARAGTD